MGKNTESWTLNETIKAKAEYRKQLALLPIEEKWKRVTALQKRFFSVRENPPITDLFEKLSKIFEKTEEFSLPDTAIRAAVEKFPVGEDTEETIFLKLTLVDALYKTQALSKRRAQIPRMLQRIYSQRDGIKNGSLAAIDILRREPGSAAKGELSLATKYACFHNSDKFAIYDSLVEQLVRGKSGEEAARPAIKFIAQVLLKAGLVVRRDDYGSYYDAVNEIKNKCFSGHNFKKLDQALWLLAKYAYDKKTFNKQVDNATSDKIEGSLKVFTEKLSKKAE